ncbi:hypothetical protein ACSTIR_20980 [Vibrio parahaemolyticus]|uniref:hypothetical protein n=1 Tax=Vibrio parahaemolyticus TaxID=670 RepID=UPI001E5557D9|nr:hypothetical protein [Vibrio parahaemolyticus]
MNSIVLDILKVNRKRFTAKQFDVLKTIASHPNGYDYRKGYESKSSNIYYLPANKQAVEDKLKPIGLTMMSIPANDGSRRKLYSLRLAKLPTNMDRCAKCGFVQLADELLNSGCVKCDREKPTDKPQAQ